MHHAVTLNRGTFCFLLGLKTYLISGRRLEHDEQLGCSQVALPSGNFVGVSLFSCPQTHTPDLIPGGAQAAEPLLPHKPAERIGVRVKVKKTALMFFPVVHNFCVASMFVLPITVAFETFVHFGRSRCTPCTMKRAVAVSAHYYF